MNLLQPAKITSAYLKMGILGFQGGGKTKTAGKTAIGLYKYMQSKGIDVTNKPVAFFDTETGSDWLIPDFRAAGVPFVTAKRRSFADLLNVIREAEAGASVLIIDSITHPWRELCESYMRKKQRTFLQMDDWAYLKGDHGWAKFTDLFINSKLHIIMCGRAGYEFEDYKDDNGKRQIEKVGTKMKTEGETGFEPSLLVLMEQVEDLHTGKVKHRATVQKDRSTLLDGFQIDNPDFKDFLPHIDRLNLGGDHIGVDINGDSQHILKTEKRDWQPVQRKIVLDEIESLIVFHIPGQAAADKKRKAELIRTHFGKCWTEMEEVMPLDELRAGYDTLHFALEEKHSRYHQQPAPEVDDKLPEHSAPPSVATANAISALVQRKREVQLPLEIDNSWVALANG
jgi:AAA domain